MLPEKNRQAETDRADRTKAVRDCLDRVTDPELDESVVAMGFIDRIGIEGGNVTVVFSLPTFLCSANFAFLMAEDMKVALEGLPWVTGATIQLRDHFAADRINQGIAKSLPFETVFAGDADEGLADIRRTFREKAFLGRQATLLDLLLRQNSASELMKLTMGDLIGLLAEDHDDVALAAARYLAARRHEGGSASPDAPAFTALDGRPLTLTALPQHRRNARRILQASRANAEMCRMVLSNRRNGTDIGALERRQIGSGNDVTRPVSPAVSQAIDQA